jgi:ribosomal subunit interface protein
VEIVVTGRHTAVSDRFRSLVEEKLTKVGQLAPKAYRANVELSHERNPRQSSNAERVEITLRGKGPVIRAEASADEPAAALDIALGKLLERLRRNGDRRKVHHGRQRPASVRMPSGQEEMVAAILTDSAIGEAHPSENGVPAAAQHAGPDRTGEDQGELGDSPVVIRTKDHSAVPMTLDQALYEMELVGHDFFLFVDADCGRPSVVYRRRGWNYGVIRLSENTGGVLASETEEVRADAAV